MQKSIIGDCSRGLRWKQVWKDIAVLYVKLKGQRTSEGQFKEIISPNRAKSKSDILPSGL